MRLNNAALKVATLKALKCWGRTGMGARVVKNRFLRMCPAKEEMLNGTLKFDWERIEDRREELRSLVRNKPYKRRRRRYRIVEMIWLRDTEYLLLLLIYSYL